MESTIFKLVALLLAVLVWETSGFCLDVGNYQDFRQSKVESDTHTLDLWIDGLVNGIQSLNSALEKSGRENLFCVPYMSRKLAYAVIDSKIKRTRYKSDASVSAVFIDALIEVFPCNEP